MIRPISELQSHLLLQSSSRNLAHEVLDLHLNELQMIPAKQIQLTGIQNKAKARLLITGVKNKSGMRSYPENYQIADLQQ